MMVIPDMLWFIFDVAMIFITLLTLYAMATNGEALRTYDTDALIPIVFCVYLMFRIAMIAS